MKIHRLFPVFPLALGLVSALTAAPSGPTADAALQLLQEGNHRFVTGKPARPDQTLAHRKEIAAGQHPYAIVLTCADSRVAPELYFDQGFGDIFVVRNAGNVLDDHVIGSIEYAVEHLHVPLILVVGHEKCGAVAAAVAGGHAPGKIGSIVESISPAVRATVALSGDRVDNTVRAHAWAVATTLAQAGPIIAEEVRHGAVKIYAARYDLDSGAVEILADAPVASEPTAAPAHAHEPPAPPAHH